jgi:hypothetical protein
MALLLSTAFTKILLNGQPGQCIEHRRGLRQSDLLSPMMFILVMDVLNRLFSKASERNLLQPIGHPAIKYQCSLYADDVILFVSPTVTQAQAIARILDIFGNASGLKTNVSKCSITPIYSTEDVLPQIQRVLPCQLCQFPITYLGVPLPTTAIPRAHIRPLIDKVASKLPAWQGPLMPKSGRLVLMKAVFSTIPTYTIMATQLPIWAIEEIDKLRRKFFWARHDSSVRGKCLVSWPVVFLPTAQGGLGVVDLRLVGITLRTRWLWLQRTDPDRAWVAPLVHVELEVKQLFEASVLVQVGNNAKTLSWTDCWLDREAVVDMASVLASLVGARIKKTRTVQQALSNRAWVQDIRGGLSVATAIEYLHLWDHLEVVALQPFRWRWTSNGQYTAHSAFLMLQHGRSVASDAKLIWDWES